MNRYTTIRLPASALCVVLAVASGLAVATNASDAAKVPRQVQQALDWQMPKNPCHKPKPPGQRKDIIDSQGVSRQEWDVDYYTLKRYNRKEQRWQKCVDDYKADLSKDFESLKNSAQHGLTQAQADIILGKLKAIQTVLMAADPG